MPPEAVLVTLLTEQDRLSVPLMLGVGTVASCVTEVVAMAVQPFAPVTVTVYVPASVMVTSAVPAMNELGPVQL